MLMSPGGSLTIYADGSSVPGGRSGAGIVVLNAAGEVLRIENVMLPTMTNNEAEYAALALALRTAAELEADVVEVRLDSEVVVDQMTGRAAVKAKSLREAHWRACELARRFPKVRYRCIPRAQNALADALAAEASAGRHWGS